MVNWLTNALAKRTKREVIEQSQFCISLDMVNNRIIARLIADTNRILTIGKARIIFLLVSTIMLCSELSAQTLEKEYSAVPIVSSKEQVKKLKIAKLYVSYYDTWYFNVGVDKDYRFNFGSNEYLYINNKDKIPFRLESLLLKRVDRYQKIPFTFILRFYRAKEWHQYSDSIKMYYGLSSVGKSEIIKEEELRKFPDQIIFQDTIHPEDINKRYFIKNPVVMPVEGLFVQLEMIKEDKKKVMFNYTPEGELINITNYPFFKERTKKRYDHLTLWKLFDKRKNLTNFYMDTHASVIDFHFEGYPLE